MASGVEKVSLIAALMAFCQGLFQTGMIRPLSGRVSAFS